MVTAPQVKQLSEKTLREQAAGRRARTMHMLEQLHEELRRQHNGKCAAEREERTYAVASLVHESEGRLEILVKHSPAMDRTDVVAVIDGVNELAEPSDIFPSEALVAQLMLVFG